MIRVEVFILILPRMKPTASSLPLCKLLLLLDLLKVMRLSHMAFLLMIIRLLFLHVRLVLIVRTRRRGLFTVNEQLRRFQRLLHGSRLNRRVFLVEILLFLILLGLSED